MWFLEKCRSNKLRKDLPIFVETFLLNGGLNHMISLTLTMSLMVSVRKYIYTESNHPPNIFKYIPASIETRLSNLSPTEAIFKKSTTH